MDSKIYLQSILADIKMYCPSVVDAPEKIKIDAAYENIFKQAGKFALGCNDGDMLHGKSIETKQLHSIFKHIRLPDSNANAQLTNFGLKPLNIEESSFYGNANENSFWKEFKAAFNNANNPQVAPRVNAENILTVLHKFAYCLPAPLQNPNGVSLYDYIRIKAGLALCLSESAIDKKQPLLLIGGAVSGIQDFIYNIISKSAAKNLKGRSFYLQLLIESVKTYILDALQLMQGNVIYASGGNFYILAPNTNTIIAQLEVLKKEIAQHIFAKHNTKLFTTFEWVAIDETHITTRAISNCWDCLVQKINLAKSQKFSDVLNYENFFEPFETGGVTTRDAITGDELTDKESERFLEKQAKTKADEEPPLPLTDASSEQIKLGKNLKNTDYIVCMPAKYGKAIKKQDEKGDKNYLCCLDILINEEETSGYKFYLLKEDHFKKIPSDILKVCTVTQLNKTDLKATPIEYIQAFDFYGGNKYPAVSDDNPEPKDFSDFAGDKDFKRIAVLRMDVDNLGSIFKNIFANNGSFVEYAALSRSLDYFFKGYLNTIWEKYKKDSQIIYSGGDDLFIVGNWTAMIAFAEEIQQKFKEYVCNNPDFTISGGLALVTHKFPIMRAADMAGDAEQDAKNHSIKIDKKPIAKNSMSFLNHCFNWTHQFGDLKQMKEKIEKWLATKKVSKSFFLNIASYYERYEELKALEKHNKKPHSDDVTLRFQLAYILAQGRDRYFKSHGAEQREWREFIQELQTKILLDSYHGDDNALRVECFKTIYVAIQWAFLHARASDEPFNNSQN